jgi:hypothetical protein
VPSGFFGLLHPVAAAQVPTSWHSSIATQVTAAPVQTPAWHLSPLVQALPSLHARPSGFVGLEQRPVAESQKPAVWQESIAAQTTGVPLVQRPLLQVSPCVQPLPSLHVAPSAFSGFEHAPVTGLQVPTSWHWLCATQTTGCVPTQTPAMHMSTFVHAVPSLHAVPSGLGTFTHVPVAGLHAPAVSHWPGGAQTTGFAPKQTPAWQVSVFVQPSPSSQGVPLGLLGVEHAPVAGLHVP